MAHASWQQNEQTVVTMASIITMTSRLSRKKHYTQNMLIKAHLMALSWKMDIS